MLNYREMQSFDVDELYLDSFQNIYVVIYTEID